MNLFGMELNSVTSSAAAMDVPARAYPPVLLFCHPSMEILAKKIVASVAESVSTFIFAAANLSFCVEHCEVVLPAKLPLLWMCFLA